MTEANQKRYLVTGGAGFIGSHVTEHMLGLGRSVTVLDNFATGKRDNLDQALAAVGGDLTDMAAFRAALRRADFDSVRGSFSFGHDQHPVQDWFVRVVEKQPDGSFVNRITGETVFIAHGNAYEAECKL